MTKEIKISDIDEFFNISNTPNSAISDNIIKQVRNLDEEKELEPFFRDIIGDSNETPHGPTEIADIICHVHLYSQSKSAAFVLKGKSFKTVKSKDITHQFAKLQTFPNLDLIIFTAVGNIQDDAKRDFIMTANNIGCDYLIINVENIARLLISYGKICPKDGTSFGDEGTCHNGHENNGHLTLEMQINEKPAHIITRHNDVSIGGAKRYDARIIIDKHYTKDVIKKIIRDITSKLRQSAYHRSELLEEKWGKSSAHVVWLFIAHDIEDVRNNNWVCRTSWISPDLNSKFRPVELEENDRIDDIIINWNEDYNTLKSIICKYQGSKEDTLKAIKLIKQEMINNAETGIKIFQQYNNRSVSNEKLILEMEKLASRVQSLDQNSNNIPIPPDDCKDYEQTCQNLFAIIDNMFIAFTESGRKTWEQSERDKMIKQYIKYYYKELDILTFEEKKLH